MDLGRLGLFSRVSSVGSGSSGFGKGNPPSDPPKSVFQDKDPSPTITGVGSASFWVGPGGLGGWIGFRFLMDSPRRRIKKNKRKKNKAPRKKFKKKNGERRKTD